MKKLVVLTIAMFLGAWGSVTMAVDMNRIEGARIWNCMERYRNMEKVTRGQIQPGQTTDSHRVIPDDLRRACELAPATPG